MKTPRDDRVEALADVMLADGPSGSVALRLSTGSYFQLKGSAAEIISLVQERGERGAALALAGRHSLSIGRAEADVDNVMALLNGPGTKPTSDSRTPTLAGTTALARAWWRLAPARKWDTVPAAGLVLVLEVLLHFFALDRVSRWLRTPLVKNCEVPISSPLDLSTLSRGEQRWLAALEWVQRAWLFDSTCLRRALARGWVLRKRRPQLCLGLVHDDEALAHAWLEVGGCSLDAIAGISTFRRAPQYQEQH